MDDLRPSRPVPSSGVGRFTPEERKLAEKSQPKKAEATGPATSPAAIPAIDDSDADSNHQLDERA